MPTSGPDTTAHTTPDTPADTPADETNDEADDERITPGSTIDTTPPPTPRALNDYTIAIVVPDDEAATQRLVAGVEAFARSAGTTVTTFRAGSGPDPVDTALFAAIATDPELVVGVGVGDIDSFDFVTAGQPQQQFLVIGAQIPEPTDNVLAVIWKGSHSRGFDEADLDPASATADRAEAAMRTGVASILDGVSGVVLNLPF